jgi:ribosome-binding factor A
MADAARARKLGERIQEIVAETLELKVKDPRLGFITVTDAKVSPDLHDATVFYTVFGSDEEAVKTAAALESCKGMVRTEVGKRTGIKFTPSITFVRDALPDSVRMIDDLLHEAATADAEVAKQAVKAQFAGEADAYRTNNKSDDAR